jgi:hypothetical protein
MEIPAGNNRRPAGAHADAATIRLHAERGLSRRGTESAPYRRWFVSCDGRRLHVGRTRCGAAPHLARSTKHPVGARLRAMEWKVEPNPPSHRAQGRSYAGRSADRCGYPPWPDSGGFGLSGGFPARFASSAFRRASSAGCSSSISCSDIRPVSQARFIG